MCEPNKKKKNETIASRGLRQFERQIRIETFRTHLKILKIEDLGRFRI